MSSRYRRTTLLLLMMILATGLPSCSGGSDSPTDPGAMSSNTIAVRDNFFDPNSITVDPGATVIWRWQGSNGHNVTWTSASLSNSATQAAGNFTVTMPTTPGTYAFYCTIHGSPNAGMRGTIVVR